MIRVMSGVCSSCGHTADPVEFMTQMAALADAPVEPPVEPAPKAKTKAKSKD